MLKYIIKRLISMFPILIGITIISFFVMHLAPGDTVTIQQSLNPKYSETARDKFVKMYNLDQPIYKQYLIWLKKFATLDFGDSFSSDGRKVIDKIGDRLPITLGLNIISMILIFIIALPLGVLSAYYRNSVFDKTVTIVVFIGFAIPMFWLALMCMYFFGIILGWLPISGLTSYNFDSLSITGQIADVIRHITLPIAITVFGGIASISRFGRTSTLEVLSQDYIMSARARGVSEKTILFRYALKNAMLPIVTLLGLSIPGLIGSSVIFESVFSIPGMGQLFYQSVMMRDYPTVMGILVIGSLLTLIGNLIADIAYAYIDPRIRYS